MRTSRIVRICSRGADARALYRILEQHTLAWGETLTRLARVRLSLNRYSEALEAIKEAISILRECDSSVYPTRRSLTRALAVKAEVLLKEGGKKHDVASVLHEAKALIQTMVSSKSKQELSEWIDRLTLSYLE